MMHRKELHSIEDIDFSNYSGVTDRYQDVKNNYIFVAIKGNAFDGHQFIDEAIKRGATLIVSNSAHPSHSCDVLKVKDTKAILGEICSKLYKVPENIIAITGTNGKTSVAYFVQQILGLLGHKCGYIGTLGVSSDYNTPIIPNAQNLTTPGTIELYKILESFAKNNVQYTALEASSHGLAQNRMRGLKFKVGAFTTFSRDHLDYHNTMEEYLEAKVKLFNDGYMEHDSCAVINKDMDVFDQISAACDKLNVLTYGYAGDFIKIKSISYDGFKSTNAAIIHDGKDIHLTLPFFSTYQIFNLMCATGIMYGLGFSIEQVFSVLPKVKNVPGRMQQVGSYNIFVDYAHTPDALESVLSEIRGCINKTSNGKLFVVFGCGGDRDKGKRPEMGSVAARLADIAIVTDDNPRGEDLAQIRSEIMAKCPGATEIDGRENAIKYAIQNMSSNDLLVIAGKGHENYQIIKDQKTHFDDYEVAMKYAKEFL